MWGGSVAGEAAEGVAEVIPGGVVMQNVLDGVWEECKLFEGHPAA